MEDLHLIPPYIPLLANLLPTLAGSDAELTLVGQIEIVGRAEAGPLRHVGHTEVGVAQQFVSHPHLKGHAEIDATHSRQHKHQGIDVLATQAVTVGKRLHVRAAIAQIEQVVVEDMKPRRLGVALHQHIAHISVLAIPPPLPHGRDIDVVKPELRFRLQFPRRVVPRNPAQPVGPRLPVFPGVSLCHIFRFRCSGHKDTNIF